MQIIVCIRCCTDNNNKINKVPPHFQSSAMDASMTCGSLMWGHRRDNPWARGKKRWKPATATTKPEYSRGDFHDSGSLNLFSCGIFASQRINQKKEREKRWNGMKCTRWHLVLAHNDRISFCRDPGTINPPRYGSLTLRSPFCRTRAHRNCPQDKSCQCGIN